MLFLVSVLFLCTLVLHVCFVFTKGTDRHAHWARHSLLKVYVLVKQSRPTEQTDYSESQWTWTHQTCTALQSVCWGISMSKTCFNINVNGFFLMHITSLRQYCRVELPLGWTRRWAQAKQFETTSSWIRHQRKLHIITLLTWTADHYILVALSVFIFNHPAKNNIYSRHTQEPLPDIFTSVVSWIPFDRLAHLRQLSAVFHHQSQEIWMWARYVWSQGRVIDT